MTMPRALILAALPAAALLAVGRVSGRERAGVRVCPSAPFRPCMN